MDQKLLVLSYLNGLCCFDAGAHWRIC